MIPALKKRLRKNAINDNDFREQLQQIRSIRSIQFYSEVEHIVEKIDYLAAHILYQSYRVSGK